MNQKMTEWHPYTPAEVLPPGETLRETLEALHMSQSKLAARTGLTLKHINQVVRGAAAITPETAIALENATGVAATTWNNLENRYQDFKLRSAEASSLADELEWLAQMPIAELKKRGHITASAREPGTQLQQALKFFGVASLTSWQAVWREPAAAFLQSAAYTVKPGSVAAWLRLGELAAEDLQTSAFDKHALKRLLPELRGLTVEPAFYPRLVQMCASVGVCLVVVPDVAGTRASGATRFVSPDRALVQLSNRGKRNDKFWFALFHELGHLVLHGKKGTFIYFEEAKTDIDAESEANSFAANLLIPSEYAARLAAVKTPQDAVELARNLGVAPGIVAGRVQRETGDYRFGNSAHLFDTFEIVQPSS